MNKIMQRNTDRKGAGVSLFADNIDFYWAAIMRIMKRAMTCINNLTNN